MAFQPCWGSFRLPALGLLVIQGLLVLNSPSSAEPKPSRGIETPIDPKNAPDYIKTTRASGQLSWRLYQNNGTFPLQAIGIRDQDCSLKYFGNESAMGGSASYAEYCLGSVPVSLAVPFPDGVSRQASLLLNTVGVKARAGWWGPQDHNVSWSARGSVTSIVSMQVYRTASDRWFLFSTPRKAFAPEPESGFWKYQIEISNGITGRLLKTISVPNTPSDSISGDQFVQLTKDIDSSPTGVPIDQPFKIDLIGQGTFQTSSTRGSPEQLFGSAVLLGFHPEQ
jgi:hypothetical protein